MPDVVEDDVSEADPERDAAEFPLFSNSRVLLQPATRVSKPANAEVKSHFELACIVRSPMNVVIKEAKETCVETGLLARRNIIRVILCSLCVAEQCHLQDHPPLPAPV